MCGWLALTSVRCGGGLSLCSCSCSCFVVAIEQAPSPYLTFKRIESKLTVEFPPAFPEVARSFVSMLLTRDPTQRLASAIGDVTAVPGRHDDGTMDALTLPYVIHPLALFPGLSCSVSRHSLLVATADAMKPCVVTDSFGAVLCCVDGT